MCDTSPVPLNDQERVLKALSRTALAEFEMQPVPVLDTGEVGLCWKVPMADARALWGEARAHAAMLGRWPVLVAEPFYSDTFGRFYYVGDADQSPAAVLSRARDLTPDAVQQVYRSFPEVDEEWWDGVAPDYVAESAARIGRHPPLSREELQQIRPDLSRLDRTLFEWEERERPTSVAEGGEYLDAEVSWSDSCGLILMPTGYSWEVPAYTDFFGASRVLGHEALIRVLADWSERVGAELLGSWGTLLELCVTRPPTDVDTAYELAVQHHAVAPYTLHGPGVSIRQHARALLNRRHWLLHERP
jgi:Domain of unknown function (DUF4253)